MGLFNLNFHIETFEGNKCCKLSLLAIASIDSDPFKSIVSIANKSKSNLSMDALDIDLLKLILEMIF
tara:strand:+ start:370 stop:570 length:201 start_codon:yes stop_codon:yes gene_type:complete